MAIKNSINDGNANIQSYNGTGTFNGRTATGTTNQIAITNGTGVSGNPTLAESPSVVITTQPCFSVRQAGNLTDVTGDGTAFVMTWDGEVIDQGNNFSSPTFTAPNTAVYHLYVTVRVSGLLAGHTSGSLAITRNGSVIFKNNLNPFAIYSATIAASNIGLEGVVKATANDTFQVVLTISGGTKVVDVPGSAAFNYFCGKLVY